MSPAKLAIKISLRLQHTDVSATTQDVTQIAAGWPGLVERLWPLHLQHYKSIDRRPHRCIRSLHLHGDTIIY